MRRIITRGSGPTLLASDALQTLFVAELFSPAGEIWLLSPWISDIPVIDNSAGAYSALFPAPRTGIIRLSDALIGLATQGIPVYLVTRSDARNRPFVTKLRGAASAAGLPISVIENDNLHEKALLTSRFLLHGSMNFTHYGREVNEESLVLDCSSDSVYRSRLDYRQRFDAS